MQKNLANTLKELDELLSELDAAMYFEEGSSVTVPIKNKIRDLVSRVHK